MRISDWSSDVCSSDLTIKARTARLGFDLAPWSGARLLATANQQEIGEYGPRSFAAYGLSQSLKIGERWSVDLSVDGNRTIGGIRAKDVLNVDHPVAPGGRSEEHTSELQSLMRISYAVFCLKKKKNYIITLNIL